VAHARVEGLLLVSVAATAAVVVRGGVVATATMVWSRLLRSRSLQSASGPRRGERSQIDASCVTLVPRGSFGSACLFL